MDELTSRQFPVQEHVGFQHRAWVAQRVGWAVLAAIVLAAAAGLFGGGGVLAKREVSGQAVTIEYERFQRMTKLARFAFALAPAAGGERRLLLGRAFQDSYEVSSIQPPPARSLAAADGLDLTFAASPSKSMQIVIWAHPRSYGSVSIDARVDDGDPVSLRIFIYP